MKERKPDLLLIAIAILTGIVGSVALSYAQELEGPRSGQEIYADECRRCHGDDGRGDTRMGQRFGVTPFEGLDEETVRDSLVNGRENMDPVEDLTDGEFDELVAYTLTLSTEPAEAEPTEPTTDETPTEPTEASE